jgi:hypothetical protein
MGGGVTLVQRNGKWVLYNSNGKVVIITENRKIAEGLMQNGNK